MKSAIPESPSKDPRCALGRHDQEPKRFSAMLHYANRLFRREIFRFVNSLICFAFRRAKRLTLARAPRAFRSIVAKAIGGRLPIAPNTRKNPP